MHVATHRCSSGPRTWGDEELGGNSFGPSDCNVQILSSESSAIVEAGGLDCFAKIRNHVSSRWQAPFHAQSGFGLAECNAALRKRLRFCCCSERWQGAFFAEVLSPCHPRFQVKDGRRAPLSFLFFLPCLI